MGIDSGGPYDRKNDEGGNWDFRYTIGIIICILIIGVGFAAIFGGNVFRSKDKGVLENDRAGDKIQLRSEGTEVTKPVPTVDSRRESEPMPSEVEKGKEGAMYVEPVEGGRLSREFSDDELVYLKTLDQYGVHKGVDFEAPADTAVRAIAGGTVTSVRDDPQMGITIEITQGDGIIAKYSNLSTKEMVEEGDVVKAGTVISGVGSTALFESLDPPHLHLEIWKDGSAINPLDYL
ncbi:MAG: peptidoglycan DD-metalloendopeptidase family protein [Anaerovoracaceae bacterium]|jgi:murein DD-endopeptidase MepM/ murein hydrolase activator NlpD